MSLGRSARLMLGNQGIHKGSVFVRVFPRQDSMAGENAGLDGVETGNFGAGGCRWQKCCIGIHLDFLSL